MLHSSAARKLETRRKHFGGAQCGIAVWRAHDVTSFNTKAYIMGLAPESAVGKHMPDGDRWRRTALKLADEMRCDFLEFLRGNGEELLQPLHLINNFAGHVGY